LEHAKHVKTGQLKRGRKLTEEEKYKYDSKTKIEELRKTLKEKC
jgi:hypothetical protein